MGKSRFDLEAIWRFLETKNGVHPVELSRFLGVDRVDGILTTLEQNGYLLSEGKNGRLYPFHKCSHAANGIQERYG